MFMSGPKMIRAAATVHSSSCRDGSGWCCMAVWGLALMGKTHPMRGRGGERQAHKQVGYQH